MMNKQLDLRSVRIYKNEKQDIIDAIDLIGQEVYMSDDADFNTYDICNLVGVRYIEDNFCPFIGRAEKRKDAYTYRFFVLAKDAKFVEKELRPFNDIKEFLNETKKQVGASIRYRNINNCLENVMLFNGYTNNELVLFGIEFFTFKELFDRFEYFDNDTKEWKRFGVEE